MACLLVIVVIVVIVPGLVDSHSYSQYYLHRSVLLQCTSTIFYAILVFIQLVGLFQTLVLSLSPSLSLKHTRTRIYFPTVLPLAVRYAKALNLISLVAVYAYFQHYRTSQRQTRPKKKETKSPVINLIT